MSVLSPINGIVRGRKATTYPLSSPTTSGISARNIQPSISLHPFFPSRSLCSPYPTSNSRSSQVCRKALTKLLRSRDRVGERSWMKWRECLWKLTRGFWEWPHWLVCYIWCEWTFASFAFGQYGANVVRRFEMLAFKSDVSHWRAQKELVGVSVRWVAIAK